MSSKRDLRTSKVLREEEKRRHRARRRRREREGSWSESQEVSKCVREEEEVKKNERRVESSERLFRTSSKILRMSSIEKDRKLLPIADTRHSPDPRSITLCSHVTKYATSIQKRRDEIFIRTPKSFSIMFVAFSSIAKCRREIMSFVTPIVNFQDCFKISKISRSTIDEDRRKRKI